MLRALLAGAALSTLLACGGNPPADHTEDHGPYRHRPGGQQAPQNCTGCHGADLRGGESAPSCYTCHGQQWD
jgi:hypothetical protein